MQMRGQQIEAEIRPTAFVGATVTGIDDDCGEDVYVLGFGDSLAEAQFVGIGFCDVLELRAALDRIADDEGRW